MKDGIHFYDLDSKELIFTLDINGMGDVFELLMKIDTVLDIQINSSCNIVLKVSDLQNIYDYTNDYIEQMDPRNQRVLLKPSIDFSQKIKSLLDRNNSVRVLGYLNKYLW